MGGRTFARPALLESTVRSAKAAAKSSRRGGTATGIDSEFNCIVVIRGPYGSHPLNMVHLLMQQISGKMGTALTRAVSVQVGPGAWQEGLDECCHFTGKIRILLRSAREVRLLIAQVHGQAIEINGETKFVEVENLHQTSMSSHAAPQPAARCPASASTAPATYNPDVSGNGPADRCSPEASTPLARPGGSSR